MRPLYELAQQFASLNALLDSDDLPPEVILDTLEGLEGDIKLKAVAVAHVILSMEAMVKSIVEAAKKRLERAKRLENRADSLRAYLQFNLQATGIKKVEHEDFDISLKKNPPAVFIDNEPDVPEIFKFQPPTPPKQIDKVAIARAIKAGQEVPGAHTETAERVSIDL